MENYSSAKGTVVVVVSFVLALLDSACIGANGESVIDLYMGVAVFSAVV